MKKPSERIYEIFCREWSNKPHHNDFDKKWGALMDYLDEQALTAQYRAGMMRAAEIAENFISIEATRVMNDGGRTLRISPEAIAQAIRTEADRLRGNGE